MFWMSGVVVACCSISGIVAALSNSSTTTGTAIGTSSTLVPSTVKPNATATPVPIGSGEHASLGSDYTETSNGFTIIGPKDTFHASDAFAYVVSLDQGIGVTSVNVQLVSVRSTGAESTVFSQVAPISNPNFSEFANRIQIGDIMQVYGQHTGTYRLQFSDSSHILASVTFQYIG